MLRSFNYALDLSNETEQERCKMNMLHAKQGQGMIMTKSWCETSMLQMYMTRSLSHGTRAQSKSEMITCFKGRLSVKLKRLILI